MSIINNIFYENMGPVGNKCIILKKEDTMKISFIQNQLRLEICEPIKNMGYMNVAHNIMFWINMLITVEQTLQYPHIDHIH